MLEKKIRTAASKQWEECLQLHQKILLHLFFNTVCLQDHFQVTIMIILFCMFLILSIETNQPDDLMNLKVDLLGSRKLSYLQTELSKLKL